MHKRNMLDALLVSMLFLSVLTINVSNVEAATLVSVQPPSQTVGQEDVLLPTSPFTINITVQGGVTDLYAWQIMLYYNPTILNTRRDLVKIPTENVFKDKEFYKFGPYIENDAKGTYIIFGATLYLDPSGVAVTDSGVLCQISFTGQAAGTSELIFSGGDRTYLLNSKDENHDGVFDEIPTSKINGQVTVLGIENPKEPSAITINVDPSNVTIGSKVTINGTLNPTRAEANVTIYYTPPHETTGTLETVSTKEFNATHCRYEYNWTTEEAGEYDLYAYWPGDENYTEAVSSEVVVTVKKWTSTISLNVYPIEVHVGSYVTMNGTIDTSKPILPYEKLTISYKRVDMANFIELATVYPSEDGVYTYTWKTNKTGSYQLWARWPGDKNSESADSIVRTVKVTGESIAYLYYLIAAIAIIAIATIVYVTKIRKRHHATHK